MNMRRGHLWEVAKVWDDGRSMRVRGGLTPKQAERLAGKMRDEMTDAECAQGWNYLARRTTPATILGSRA